MSKHQVINHLKALQKKSNNTTFKCVRLILLAEKIKECFFKKYIFMSRYLQNRDNVSLCHKDNCIHANRDNAKLIDLGTFAMLLRIGISAFA